MKVKIKYNSWFSRFIKRNGIVLYPYILISRTEKEAKKEHILNHEYIHVQQIKREGFLRFYLKYLAELFFNLFAYMSFNKAYGDISYEKEAYFRAKKITLPKHLQ